MAWDTSRTSNKKRLSTVQQDRRGRFQHLFSEHTLRSVSGCQFQINHILTIRIHNAK